MIIMKMNLADLRVEVHKDSAGSIPSSLDMLSIVSRKRRFRPIASLMIFALAATWQSSIQGRR